MSLRVLMIDNYDSFTYNIVHLLGKCGAEARVIRNDETDVETILASDLDALIISPGPCSPKEAGISVPSIKAFAGRIPILGVCLGHQSIGYAFGAEIVRAKAIVHGKSSLVFHRGKGLYSGIENPFEAIRYHSLAIDKTSLPDCFDVTAWTHDGEIMGIRHKTMMIEGVQFHPESILTKCGERIIRNFLAMVEVGRD